MVAQSGSKRDALTCEICKTADGMERPIGRVIVEISEVEIEDAKMFLCQVCHKNKINTINQKKRKESSGNKWIDKLKNLGFV